MVHVKELEVGEWRPQSLSFDVIKRSMPQKDLEKFMKSYYGARLRTRNTNRFSGLQKPVSKEDVELVMWFFDESQKEVSVKDKAQQIGTSKDKLQYKLNSVIVKLAYQNKKKLGL